jgi:hypothetical protein
MTTPNKALLGQVLDYIKRYPDTWYRGDWSLTTDCGTSHCFAGWAVKLAGVPMDEDDEVLRAQLPDPSQIERHIDDDPASPGYVHVSVAARHLLGLTPEQADELFSGVNTVKDLERYVAELCGETESSAAS